MKNPFEKFFGRKNNTIAQNESKTAETATFEAGNTNDNEILNKLKRRAYIEAEVDLGTNAQAKAEVSKLGPNDFNYIYRVEELVKQKLNNPGWVKNTKEQIEGGAGKPSGIKANDELYHSGRGILESYAKEQEEIEKIKGEIKNSLD